MKVLKSVHWCKEMCAREVISQTPRDSQKEVIPSDRPRHQNTG